MISLARVARRCPAGSRSRGAGAAGAAVAFGFLLAATGILGMSAGSAAQRKSAASLRASAQCIGTPPKPIAYLRWTPSGAGAQRVDVTLFADGFATRHFDHSVRLSPARSRLSWRRVSGEAIHHWRVLTRVKGRWYSSAIATFDGPGCVGADMQPQMP
jgi:hypothetical protein